MKPARFELRKRESTPSGLLRIVKSVSQASVARIQRASGDRESAVHDTRLAIKQLRALLRLVRPRLTGKFFDAENARLREAARRLAPLRDVEVARRTIEKILRKIKRREDREAFERALEGFNSAGSNGNRRSAAQATRSAVQALESCAENWARLTLSQEGWKVIEPGLCAMYQQNRKWMKRAMDSGKDTAFHGWRKRVKYLGYQIRVAAPLWRGKIEKMAEDLDELQELLGADHDLVILKGFLSRDPGRFGGRAQTECALGYLARRSRRLRKRSRKLGKEIFHEAPARLMRKLH